MELKKALYGTLQAALILWRNLTPSLQEWGFIINPYDWCVVNETVNNKQLTMVWQFDELKTSYVNYSAVKEVITQLIKCYGKEADLTIHEGKVHDYRGIRLDYRT